MLSSAHKQQLSAVAYMSSHLGSYDRLIECPDGEPALAHASSSLPVIHQFFKER